MPTRKISRWEFEVRSYEIGRHGAVESGTIANYLEEVAVRASADNGYDNKWYLDNGYIWLINHWTVRFYQPLRYGDRIETRSWVSNFRRVQSHREYELLRNGQRVVRARANWVFLDTARERPTRLLDEFYDAFRPSEEELEPLDLTIGPKAGVTNGRIFSTEHTVQRRELDRVWHANNAQYFRWVEDAMYSVLGACGWIESSENTLTARPVGHEMSYKVGVQLGDILHIESRIVGVEGVVVYWLHEVKLAATEQVVAVNRSAISFFDDEEPTLPPDSLLAYLHQD
ncbi:MAG: hypothetical protein GYB66_01775 [Chloroflexi bacterium]|nr:hypothetical protein [Chloroflexota bacterium]